MVQRFRLPHPRIPGLAACLCAGAFLPAFAPALRAVPAPSAASASPVPASAAAELTTLSDGSAAEAWLAQNIPVGATLADHPEFFAAASEVFFDADESLLVFVYRSAERGRWIAWVSFDSERMTVVHTAATGL